MFVRDSITATRLTNILCRTIEHLQELTDPPDERGVSVAPLWKTPRPAGDLLIFALLLHDTGKECRWRTTSRVFGKRWKQRRKRLGLSAKKKSEVHFLIEHHLPCRRRCSGATFSTRPSFPDSAEKRGTLERLQRLTLLTYADIHAVKPGSPNAVEAEMLWQLFVATSNHFSRTLDRNLCMPPMRNRCWSRCVCWQWTRNTADIERFLEGSRALPCVHSAAEIGGILAMYQKLSASSLQTELTPERHGFSLTLLTADRPALFSTISAFRRWA